MGEGLKRARRAAKASRKKAQPKVIMVTDSCGCVFCDIGFKPDSTVDGRPVHYRAREKPDEYVFCTAEAEAS